MNKVGITHFKCVKLLRCFVIGLFTASFIFGYFIFRNKGVFTVCDDFNSQQLTFAQAVWNVIHSGGQWCWNLDLGASLVGGFSFYNLGSPFYWIFLAFPRGMFPYLSGPLYILKYAVACVTAYAYFECFYKNKTANEKDYALIGALLYAFSGFQTVNLEFFHFHDVVALFPLLLWGIENIDKKSKRPLFVLSIFLNCLVNYFFFIQEVVFMIIYFVIRFWGQPVKNLLRKIINCIACGILGVGMASILFIPSILYIMGSTRSEMALYLSNLVWDSKSFLYILKGILLPGDSMRGTSAVCSANWTSTSCYLPLVGMSGVIAFIKKDRSWLQRLLILLFAISALPFAQSGFLLFTAVYQRWWYMFVLVMVLATVKVLEKPNEYLMSNGIWIYVITTSVFYFCIKHIAWSSYKEQMIFFEDRFAYFFVIAIFTPILLDLLLRIDKFSFRIIFPITMMCCIITTGLTLHYYRYDSDTNKYFEKYEASINLKKINDQYRYNSTDNVCTLTSDAAGIGVFSSTIENSSHEFSKLFDYDFDNISEQRASIPGLSQLLGAKYDITTDENSENVVDKVSYGKKTLYVTERNAFPIGFAIDHYFFANELVSLPQEQRGKALMHGAVIFPSNEEDVIDNLTYLDVNTINYDESIDELITRADKVAVKDFSRDGHGFRCSTDYEQDKIVYFSVPNDRGWTATIDGQRTRIIDSGGMMLIKVPHGKHLITFDFKTYGLKYGVVLSALSWIVFIAFCILTIKRSLENKNGSTT